MYIFFWVDLKNTGLLYVKLSFLFLIVNCTAEVLDTSYFLKGNDGNQCSMHFLFRMQFPSLVDILTEWVSENEIIWKIIVAFNKLASKIQIMNY